MPGRRGEGAMLAIFAGLMLVALAGETADERSSDAMKVMFARSDGAHQMAGDGMVHCTKARDEVCRPSRDRSGTLTCTYREYAKSGPWPRKTIVIRYAEGDWRWVSGDPGKCSITVF